MSSNIEGDEVPIAVLPIKYSQSMHPNLHLHQFHLLGRSLVVPPEAQEAGKIIKARYKSKTGRYEIHLPNDVRASHWNAGKGLGYGSARFEQDREEAAVHDIKLKSKEPQETRLSETRLTSEKVEHHGEYVIGVVRDGCLHLHPISETHQFKPNLSYLDFSRKTSSKRAALGAPVNPASDDEGPDSDDADDDHPAVGSAASKPKKRPGAGAGLREISVSAKRTDDGWQGASLSDVRLEIMAKTQSEREARWFDLEYRGIESVEGGEAYEKLFSTRSDVLECASSMSSILDNVKGLR
ncbi:DNA-directed RNA polymerase III subunit Rpc5 [Cantharellus anzutake]|uniref:DNA-directed RNA polymerase III subunit Rpc5 n=1 Tax=Cantharellus anzutake TaxID=1750568 RepID=UPI0019037895|nr:DNA-directed RNA polymerase III subunit Rpc5 [Cantharellus anzutake]KAF8337418.1 DNA-directed RNA polymerase III subunit Rpc5 [Cantharellus anzutake]